MNRLNLFFAAALAVLLAGCSAGKTLDAPGRLVAINGSSLSGVTWTTTDHGSRLDVTEVPPEGIFLRIEFPQRAPSMAGNLLPRTFFFARLCLATALI